MNGNTEQHKSGERIAKVIARAGLTSRREAEEWIAAGRVAVNGAVIASPALNVTGTDHITVDGEPLPERERTRLFLYHKPRGLMTTHADPQGRPTIFQKLPQSLPRLISVGRLDFNTEGLLLLTNDGALARVLELPATGWLRRYRVRAHGAVTQKELDALRGGITISGIHYGKIEAAIERVQGSNLWVSFAIREGKNREVRNVLSHLGLTVTRLIRVSFGPFQLAELAEGAVDEVRTRTLREQLGDKLAALSGADFSSSVAPPRTPYKRDDKRDENAPRNGRNRRRKGPRSAPPPTMPGASTKRIIAPRNYTANFTAAAATVRNRSGHDGKTRADVLSDRRGRPVTVERFGKPPAREPVWQDRRDDARDDAPKRERQERNSRRQPNRRRAPDRAAGARPRHPKGRR